MTKREKLDIIEKIHECGVSTMAIKRATHSIIEQIYGVIPPRPDHLAVDMIGCDESFACGDARLTELEMIMDIGDAAVAMPLRGLIPNSFTPCPAIISLSLDSAIPNRYLPAEELVERGYAIFNLDVNAFSSNNADFRSGAAHRVCGSRKKKCAPGKIALWAWAARVVTDYVCKLDEIDKSAIALCGHGMLAEAAILMAAEDDRITYVIANGLTSNLRIRGELGYLFTPEYDGTADRIGTLIEACAHKVLLIGTAADEPFADVEEDLGLLKRHCPNKLPDTDATAIPLVVEGEIHYHARGGGEYFSRKDWNLYLDFIDKKCGRKAAF